MKKNINKFLYGAILLVGLFFIWTVYVDNRSVSNQNAKENLQTSEVQEIQPAEKVQVYVFHSTARCYSCVTMGKYAKAVVEESFQSELKSGKIEFREINVDLPENREVAKKFRASGTALFINAIIDGQDNIKEETQAWRLLGDKQALSDYLSKKLRGLIGEKISTEAQKEIEEKNITFYFADNCSECVNIEKYLADNDVKNKVAFEEKNIDENEVDAEQMAEDALQCNVDFETFSVPFLWAEGECYLEEKDIINFFAQKI